MTHSKLFFSRLFNMKNVAVIFVLSIFLASCASNRYGCPYTDTQVPEQKIETENLAVFKKAEKEIHTTEKFVLSEIIICE